MGKGGANSWSLKHIGGLGGCGTKVAPWKGEVQGRFWEDSGQIRSLLL